MLEKNAFSYRLVTASIDKILAGLQGTIMRERSIQTGNIPGKEEACDLRYLEIQNC